MVEINKCACGNEIKNSGMRHYRNDTRVCYECAFPKKNKSDEKPYTYPPGEFNKSIEQGESVTAYKCLSCNNMITTPNSYCSECSDTPSGCKCSDPTPDNYRAMWEKGVKVFDKVVIQLNHVESENKLLSEMTTILQKEKFDLKMENEHFKKVLGDNGWEVPDE